MWHIHEERKLREKFLLLVNLISIPVGAIHLRAFFQVCSFPRHRGGRRWGGWACVEIYRKRTTGGCSPAGPSLTCAAFSLNLKDNSGFKRQQRVVGIVNLLQLQTHTNWLHIIMCCRQCLQSFLLGPLSIHINSALCQSASQAGQRSNREDAWNCDSKLRLTPLIRAALWLHTNLFTMVSLTHSCLIVTKHGEASGPSSSPPLWPTVSLTSWNQAWFLPRLAYQRISAEQKSKQTLTIKKHSWKCGC